MYSRVAHKNQMMQLFPDFPKLVMKELTEDKNTMRKLLDDQIE